MPPARPLPLTESLRRWSTERATQRAFTFVDFPTPDSPGRHRSLTWKRLDSQARTIAWRLRADVGPGERAALMLPQGLGYVAAFLGCLYAGVIAVPLFSPDLPGHADRLAAVLDDCEPSCIVTDTATAPVIAAFASDHGIPHLPVLRIDRPAGVQPRPDQDRALPVPEPDDIAYLQYTSGSTRVPAGVMISHGNVVANAAQAVAAFDATADGNTSVGWLPLFHDMGLVLSVAAPVLAGLPSVLMDPVSFLERPVRWLRLLGGYPGTISAAPNFAYDYCAARIDAEQAAPLRLDRVHVMINGSEPVRPGTVERFQRAFAHTGLPPQAHCPSYGLAEATVFVTTDPPADPPRTLLCDREALAAGEILPCADDDALATALVGCGMPVGQELRITDPATGLVLPEDRIGEIRLRGPNIGLGYWKRTGRSQASFASRIPGEEGDWLRTGDLGALHEGRLQVTGRLKDLLIVDGRNHYPQDLEETVQSSLDCVRRDRLALFTVAADGRPDEVVAVAEHARDLDVTPELCAAAERAARARISARHGVRLARLLLVPPGAVPRTSSGKVSRSACRERYLAGAYEGEYGKGAAAGE
ncbi:fatty acyl-AMP ligase [Streptomyces sp. SPB162]|uniref:fatty acyl-AMP ligase n=1 Tax=Streptomyces sp. SPB162 TaxID=2940560 RepID=UPI00240725FC|nr:fatty acyl-AMP ligase [Streptomyces sp. SPB162]MDF9816939.1 acyl-CoA synthetase (AMP-forming)/AMP-acid ligase II [Streptomyces sp. SPB162]